jgi:hypothetical protein
MQPRALGCAAQCLLRLARHSEIDRPLIAQPAEPAGCGPACPLVWEGRSREASPYPAFMGAQSRSDLSWAAGRALGTRHQRAGNVPAIVLMHAIYD